MSVKRKSMGIAILGLFAAITVVLQILSYSVKIGTFNLSLVLIPIILAATLYGPKYGAILGGVFGVVVTLASAFGLDTGGQILFQSAPFLTTLVCMVKGVLAGFLAGVISTPFMKKGNSFLGVIMAAIVTPIVNTGVFVLGMFVCFYDTLTAWAGGTEVVYYAVVGLVGVNFLIEFAINLLLSPAVLRVITALKKLVK